MATHGMERKQEVGQPLRAEVKTLAFWRFVGDAQQFSGRCRYSEKSKSSLAEVNWSIDMDQIQKSLNLAALRLKFWEL